MVKSYSPQQKQMKKEMSMKFESLIEWCELANNGKSKDYEVVFKAKDGVEHDFNSFEVLNSEKKIVLSEISVDEWT